MIRFEGMPPEVMEAMCTPMHQILPTHFPTSTSPLISTVRPVHSGIQPGALFLGSMTAAMDRDLLARHHITHVVHVLEVDFPWLPISEKDLFRSFKINILDNPTADLRPHLESACEYIARALNTGGSVLVHCHQGVSRSPAIVIAYLINNLGMSYDQAYALVKRCRPCIKPNAGFVDALRAWESRPQYRRATTSTGVAPIDPSCQLIRHISYSGNGGNVRQ